MTADTYYTVLGISEKASQADIKRAWQELLKQVHPDKVGSAPEYWRRAAEEKTKEVNEAYQVLSDSTKRRRYNQLLEALRATQTPPQPQYQAPPQTHNAPRQAPTAARSSTPTPTRFGTGRYDWAAFLSITLVTIFVVAAAISHPSTPAIAGALFLNVVGFLLFLKKHRWLSLLPFLVALDFVIGSDARKSTPTATVSVATDSTLSPKIDPSVPSSPTFSALKAGTVVTVYNDDGSENGKPWEIDWSTYRPFPKGATQTCPGEDFVNGKLVKHDNCQPIPNGATGRAKSIHGAWFYVKMIPPVPNTEGVSSGGNATAQYELGSTYFNANNYTQAALWFRKAAEQGKMEAQYELGSMYNCGCYGLNKDDTQATLWLKKAAEQGYLFAQRDLGKLYHGHGYDVEAVYWFRKAAEQGNEEAHAWLVRMGKEQ